MKICKSNCTRHLAAEVIDEHTARVEKAAPSEDLLELSKVIVPFLLSHNAEPDACDVLVELEALDDLISLVDSNNYQRVCLYLTRYGRDSEEFLIVYLFLAA